MNGHGHSTNGNGAHRGVANGNGGSSLPVNWERLARATAHPLRVSILEILGIDGGRTMSPSDLCRELQIPLSNTNYHVTELAKADLIELVRERQVRGATEHFYRLPASAAAGMSAEETRAPTLRAVA
ncbi:MAG TPA: helix-turn-helix domain-containing protein [Solirubrobacterales bacterium]|nr:helix-turn-helix domain-containing protein [Solirubrobacterales bacterium]